MQKKKALSDLSLDELQARKKQFYGAATGLGIVMLAAIITLIYFSTKVEKGAPFIAIACGGFTTLLPFLIYRNQLNAEIRKRTA